jgi:CRISPR/Cas system endoribonuclease Cas6 (RAMP superfamily)
MKKNGKKKEVKFLLELKEWAEEIDSVMVKNYQEYKREEKPNRKLRELQIIVMYNPRYLEEKESYAVNLDALRSYYSLSHPR